MRLALCMEYPLHQRGGVEALMRTLIEGLNDRLELFLVSPDDQAILATSPHGPMLRGHFQWKPKDYSLAQYDGLCAWARENHISLFHFHFGGTYSWNARSWAQCPVTRISNAGFRCISTNHAASGFWQFVGSHRSLPIRIAALMCCWPAKIRQILSVECEILVSNHNLKNMRRWYFPVKSRFRQIYHSTLETSAAPSVFAPERKVILNLATVAFLKGQHVLAEAFARIAGEFPDWHLHLIGYHAGDGCADAVRGIAGRHGLTGRIHLPGATNDPTSALGTAAIYVQPSLLEGLGLSLQEALFYQRACIGSKVGGIPELIRDGENGLLVPPAEPEALAGALRRLIKDESLRQKFGTAGKQHILAKGMTREAMIARHLEIYNR